MDWSFRLLVDLSTLALLAFAAHSCHTFAHTLPDKLAVTIPLVVHMVSPAMSASGTRVLVMPHAMSHSRLSPSTWTVLTVREED